MNAHWILIANASHARLLQQQGDGPLALLQSYQHPASRLHSSTLGDDKAGRELSGHGFGGAAFEPRVDAQRKEHLLFARELAAVLEEGALQERYGALTLFAASPFLGELKQALGDHARARLQAAHDLDLSSVGLAELPRRIAQAAPSH
jgi:protein required for attachment to host cells